MNLLRIVHAYFLKIRFSAFIVAALITVSMLMGVFTVSRIEFMSFDYKMVSCGEAELLYCAVDFDMNLFWGNLSSDAIYENLSEAMTCVSGMPGINYLYAVKTASSAIYQGKSISIVLYDPNMINDFQGLKELGIDFSRNEEGCILIGPMFDSQRGDAIELEFTRPFEHKETFGICGKISSPDRYFCFTGVNSGEMTADCMLENGSAIVMLATEENLSRLEKWMKTIHNTSNFIVAFSPDATDEEKTAVRETFENFGHTETIQSIQRNTKKEMDVTMEKDLPRPIFLTISSAIAFFSILILFFQKKQRDISIMYICGASKKKCAEVSILSGAVVAFFPTVLCLLLTRTVDYMGRNGMIDIYGLLFTRSSYLVIIIYFICAILISAAVAAFSMAGKTPISYLRGSNK